METVQVLFWYSIISRVTKFGNVWRAKAVSADRIKCRMKQIYLPFLSLWASWKCSIRYILINANNDLAPVSKVPLSKMDLGCSQYKRLLRSNLTYMELFRCVSQKYNLSFGSNFLVGVYFKISFGSVELQNKTLSTDVIGFETFIAARTRNTSGIN